MATWRLIFGSRPEIDDAHRAAAEFLDHLVAAERGGLAQPFDHHGRVGALLADAAEHRAFAGLLRAARSCR